MNLLDILFGKKTDMKIEDLIPVNTTEEPTKDYAPTTSYFTDKELMCKCGCGEVHMQGDFLDKLNEARHMAGKPWKVNSAYRCAAHNKAVGGVAGSSHTKGYAVDISATSSQKRFEIVSNAMKAGINRIGIGKTFVHLDTDPTKAGNVIFLY